MQKGVLLTHGKLIAGVATAAVALGVSGAAVAATSSSAPAKATINAVGKQSMKPNRYVKDGLRWNHDVYHVRSGGTLRIVNLAASEGPHTFSVVRKKDLPRTIGQMNSCLNPGHICFKYAQAHGADPSTNGPPKFQYTDNFTGQNTPVNVNSVGDSGVTGPGRKGEHITLKVTAKKGTTLYFMCVIHPWMQAKVVVG